MSEYVAHIQLPDAAIGGVIHYLVADSDGVASTTLHCEGGTWLSVGFRGESADDATMFMSMLRYTIGQLQGVSMPHGYDPNCLTMFEHSPMIICHGNTVIHSEGV